jgi:GTP-binding protein YchF
MILLDQAVIENNLEKRERKIKLTGDKSGVKEMDLLRRCLVLLEDERPLIELDLNKEDEKKLRGYQFLTRKPRLIVLNIDENSIGERKALLDRYAHFVTPGIQELAVICAKIEMELVTLDEQERVEFMKDLGIDTPAVQKVIRKAYGLLGLISFLTLGPTEVRAWPVERGTIVTRAAGTIHTDMERGFIRAEVVRYDDYVEYQSPAALKAAGKMRLEGKEYVVDDGDIILFRFNV